MSPLGSDHVPATGDWRKEKQGKSMQEIYTENTTK